MKATWKVAMLKHQEYELHDGRWNQFFLKCMYYYVDWWNMFEEINPTFLTVVLEPNSWGARYFIIYWELAQWYVDICFHVPRVEPVISTWWRSQAFSYFMFIWKNISSSSSLHGFVATSGIWNESCMPNPLST